MICQTAFDSNLPFMASSLCLTLDSTSRATTESYTAHGSTAVWILRPTTFLWLSRCFSSAKVHDSCTMQFLLLMTSYYHASFSFGIFTEDSASNWLKCCYYNLISRATVSHDFYLLSYYFTALAVIYFWIPSSKLCGTRRCCLISHSSL